MFELIVESDFAAAHFLREYQGRCESMHGHNWRIEVRLQAEVLDKLGMVMDFGDVKKFVNGILDDLDHGCLNEKTPFGTANPTTENIAQYIYKELARQLPDHIRVSRVSAWETDHCGAAYFED